MMKIFDAFLATGIILILFFCLFCLFDGRYDWTGGDSD